MFLINLCTNKIKYKFIRRIRKRPSIIVFQTSETVNSIVHKGDDYLSYFGILEHVDKVLQHWHSFTYVEPVNSH